MGSGETEKVWLVGFGNTDDGICVQATAFDFQRLKKRPMEIKGRSLYTDSIVRNAIANSIALYPSDIAP